MVVVGDTSGPSRYRLLEHVQSVVSICYDDSPTDEDIIVFIAGCGAYILKVGARIVADYYILQSKERVELAEIGFERRKNLRGFRDEMRALKLEEMALQKEKLAFEEEKMFLTKRS